MWIVNIKLIVYDFLISYFCISYSSFSDTYQQVLPWMNHVTCMLVTTDILVTNNLNSVNNLLHVCREGSFL